VTLGRVIGNVVATQKNDRYEGARVLVVEPIDLDGSRIGSELLALDSVDAGPGDIVILVREGWGASTAATGRPQAAIDTAIVGVVDRIDLVE
jgi:ethanolamine utilization protein EutN